MEIEFKAILGDQVNAVPARKRCRRKVKRSLKPNPCAAQRLCYHKCYEIPEETRLAVFTFFHGLSRKNRSKWIREHVLGVPIKRRRTDTYKKSCTYNYFINDGRGPRQVCKAFLICTLGVSNNLIHYNLAKKWFFVPHQLFILQWYLLPNNFTKATFIMLTSVFVDECCLLLYLILIKSFSFTRSRLNWKRKVRKFNRSGYQC